MVREKKGAFGSWEGILTFNINMEHTDGSHTHNYMNADGTESGTCTKCGISKDAGTGNPGTGDGNDTPPAGHEHTFVDGVCTGCGEKENGGTGSEGTGDGEDAGGSENQHECTYTETVIKEPSCSEGLKELKCTECGSLKYEDIPATSEHSFSEDRQTCNNDGCAAKNPDYAIKNLDLGTEADIGYWNYTLDDVSKTVTLNYYDSSLEEGYDWHNPRECVDVYASYDIGGTVYKTQLASQDQARSFSKSAYFFRKNASFIDEISFSDKIDTSNLTGTVQMFAGLTGLKNINWGSFDTSNVTNMAGMFEESFQVNNVSLDLSVLNTENVTDMSYMFYQSSYDKDTYGLKNINLSGFSTSNVTNMSYMFALSFGLERLDLSSFDTSNVTNMSGMFSGCILLQGLNLSNFNTSNVSKMNSMFSMCDSMKTLNVSGFNTSNTTTMESMFKDCKSLKSLDVLNFDTSKVVSMKNMFQSIGVQNLDLSSFNTENVTDMSYMFSSGNLRNVNLSSFSTKKVKNFTSMFSNCINIENLNLTSFTNQCVYGTKQAYVDYMFKNTVLLEKVLVGENWDKECINDNTFEGSGCTGFTWE